MRKFCIYITLFISAALYSQSYLSSSLPSPKTYGEDCYVCNPDSILSKECCTTLNNTAADLEQRVGVELAIGAINAISGDDAYSFALNLFNSWGVGKREKNNGVLILLVLQSRDIQIITGGGVEGLLPDAVCKRIIENDMVPPLSAGRYNEGMVQGAQAIAARLLTDEAQAELLLDLHKKKNDGNNILALYLAAALIMLIILALYAYSLLNNNPTSANNIRYRHARTGRGVFIIFSIIFPLPIALLALYYRRACRSLRTAAIQCPECHHNMRLLSEKEEDAWLSPLQQAEERLQSADYDVWLCPSCLNHIILPYDSNDTSSYTHCPRCQARTFIQTADVVTMPPSSFRNGQGLRTYTCRHCGFRELKPYTIAKTPPVIIAGSAKGDSFGGGISGSSSFGGGMSFGGGAGGKF